jgi:hypothetical protein
VSGLLHAPTALSSVREPLRYPSDRRWGGLQNRFGRGGEKKIQSLPLPELEPRSSSPSVVSIVAELLRLFHHHHQHHHLLLLLLLLLLPSRYRPTARSVFRSLTSELMNLFGQLVGLLGREISPTQGLYLHRTTQHRKSADTHPCSEQDSNLRSQCSSGRRQYVP